jgi:predicted branched-subunit amino acid permease
MPRDEHPEPSLGYDWSALREGALALVCLAGLVMFSSFLGFGALLRSLDVSLAHGLATNVLIFALPGQVVFIDMMSDGSGLLLAALAVTLTAVRLLPMVITVLARARLPGFPTWPQFVVAQFTAITTWIIAAGHLDSLAPRRRLPWLLGLGLAQVVLICSATTLGYLSADSLPMPVATALVFLTPCFFLIALLQGSRGLSDHLSIALGAGIGIITMQFAPDYDLLVAGVAGGTLAFLLGRTGKSGAR